MTITYHNNAYYTQTETTLIDTGTSIPIIAWKLTKNQSHIISDISIPGRLQHSIVSSNRKVKGEF